ncbi:MAG TPA: ATPase, T2SS/T4P/T4SS family, partial [Acidimicrobiales bacterium]|nr:ATPase, T2SS/T4P/T4SS family [Acidimicrobiales bacterium]
MNRATALARSRWNRRLGQVLVTTGALADEDLARWTDEAASSGESLAAVLVRRRACDSRVVLEAMSQISGLSVVDPFEEPPDPEAMKLVSAKLARDLNAIGYRLESSKLVLAFADPPEAEELRALAVVFERQVLAVLATPMAVQAVIESAYPTDSQAQPDLSDPAVVARVMMEAQARIAMSQAPQTSPPEPGPAPAPEAERPLDQLVREAEQAIQAPPPGLGQAAGPPAGANLLDWGPEPAPASSGPPERASGNGAGPAPAEAIGDDVLPVHIDDLLEVVCAAGASDLHLSAGMPPSMRLNGSIRPIEGYEPLDGQTVREMVFGILTQTLRERFEADKELDTSHALPGVGRFRVNVFMQRNCVGAVLRAIPHAIPPFEALGLPPVIKTFTELQRGLVLVTGPTGSGKSTTLASLIDIINKTKPVHIVTVEDPIEFLHRHQHAIINQREVGQDTHGFSEALRHVLRQDPDVILVGEMRD